MNTTRTKTEASFFCLEEESLATPFLSLFQHELPSRLSLHLEIIIFCYIHTYTYILPLYNLGMDYGFGYWTCEIKDWRMGMVLLSLPLAENIDRDLSLRNACCN